MARSRLWLAALAAAALLLAGAPAATAFGGGGDEAAGPEATGPASTVSASCQMWAGQSGFGMVCKRYSGGGLTIEEILDGDPVPECWHSPVPEEIAPQYEELEQQYEAQGERGAFWLQTCMTGVDPETLEVTGEIEFTEEVVWLRADQVRIELTDNQARLVAIERRDATFPMPMVAGSPAVRPRVGQPTAFYVANEHELGPISYNRPGRGLLQMRARLIHLRVVPEPGARAIGCADGGQPAALGDTPTSLPGACWHTYTSSSAALPDQAYPVQAVATWAVEYSNPGGGWTRLATIAKEQILLQPVTEIQTLVIP